MSQFREVRIGFQVLDSSTVQLAVLVWEERNRDTKISLRQRVELHKAVEFSHVSLNSKSKYLRKAIRYQ